MSQDHFSGVAADYARFRPGYPAALFDWLAARTPGHDFAWDCGCGNGQASVPLAERYRRVAATDASARQIELAPPQPRIEYRVAPAEASGLPDHSADLVTVAQALHWFDFDRFYTEVERVLKPGGYSPPGPTSCCGPNRRSTTSWPISTRTPLALTGRRSGDGSISPTAATCLSRFGKSPRPRSRSG